MFKWSNGQARQIVRRTGKGWLACKKAQNQETVEKRIANSDGRTDGIDGLIFQEHSIMGLSQPAYSLAAI